MATFWATFGKLWSTFLFQHLVTLSKLELLMWKGLFPFKSATVTIVKFPISLLLCVAN